MLTVNVTHEKEDRSFAAQIDNFCSGVDVKEKVNLVCSLVKSSEFAFRQWHTFTQYTKAQFH